jgi:hypothetical protein
MFKFSKSINTVKANPLAEMESAINSAIAVAQKNGVRDDFIVESLEGLLPGLQYRAHVQQERRRANPLPVMHDPRTMKPIDAHAEAARAEEKRTARELRQQQAAYRKSVEEAAKCEDFLR